jgi:hypothetical protein
MSSSKNEGTQSIRVESGERVILSPESQRFRENYRQVQPRTAKEVRRIIGLSAEMAKTLHERGGCCQPSMSLSAIVPAEELDSPNDSIRARALDITDKALYSYVCSANPAGMVQMEPAIERYLEIINLVLNIVTLQDIEVADGAILTISSDTHLVEANKIIIHNAGRIDCSGFTKLNVISIEGT